MRNENDYQLRDDASYVKAVGTSIDAFKADLARTGMIPAAKSSMVTLWDEYFDMFNQVVASHEEVAGFRLGNL